MRRRVRFLLLYAVIALPLVVNGAINALKVNANSPLDWVGSDFAPRRDYDEFCDAFGPGDVVVISWPGCTLAEERLDVLCDAIRRSSLFYDANGRWSFQRVNSGRELMATLTGPNLKLSPDEAADRIQGIFVGDDRATTSVIVTFTKAALVRRRELVNRLQSIVTHYCGVPREEQHLAGPVIDGLAVDLASQRSLDSLALPAGLVVFAVAWWALESLAAALIVCGISYYCQALTLALVDFNGDTMNALLIVMPPLIQALAVAGGIHLANYFLNALGERRPAEAASHAFRTGWLPCLLSGATTAVGLASLVASRVVPIRAFGQYAAAGVVLTTAAVLALVPGALALLPGVCFRAVDAGRRPMRHLWRIGTLLLTRYHLHVTTVGLLAMAAMGLGVGQLTTSVRIETLFSPGSRILNDYAWIEKHVGPMVPIEVLVDCDEKCQLTPAERLRLVERLRAELSRVDHVRAAIGGSAFVPRTFWARYEPPAPPGALDQLALACQPVQEQTGYLHRQSGAQVWRLTAYVSALKDIDYGEFIRIVEQRLRDQLLDEQRRLPPGITLRSTGIMPLVHAIQGQLLDDLLKSFLTAFGLIAVMMIVVEAGVLTGLAAMVPNVFPAVILFGVLGWTHTPLDIGSIMTASVALGIAVDDTLHFLTFFRRGLAAGQSRKKAVYNAYTHCGRAMMQTSLVCGLGIGVFAASEFLPTSRFAWIMALQLLAALAGDLILLPALLLGPLGRLYEAQEAPSAEALNQGHVLRKSHPRREITPEHSAFDAAPAALTRPRRKAS